MHVERLGLRLCLLVTSSRNYFLAIWAMKKTVSILLGDDVDTLYCSSLDTFTEDEKEALKDPQRAAEFRKELDNQMNVSAC